MMYRKGQKANITRRSIAYVRVSTEDQAREGVSLAAQEAKIASYCAALEFPLAEVVRDAGESAKSLQRPGIAQILEWVREGSVDRIIVAKLDRLTRSVRDLADLIELCAKHDVALVSIGETLDTSTAAGCMIVNMLGVISQWEREAIGERTATALAHKRQQRAVYGTTPFGYRREGDALVPDAVEQAALSEAVRMDRAGSSFREIQRFFEKRGVRPHRGKAWYLATVRDVLRSRIVLEAAGAAS
jgi:site-specific DNA recombinase